MVFVPFIFVGVCVILATYSAFYTYKFMKSYSGKFKKAVQYLFFGIALFTLLIIEFGFLLSLHTSFFFTILIALTGITAFIILLEASKSIYKSENELFISQLEEQKKFLKKKTKLIQTKYLKRKISEDMFKTLLLDLEKEIIDTDAKILMLKNKLKE
jgi:hypothetical protein